MERSVTVFDQHVRDVAIKIKIFINTFYVDTYIALKLFDIKITFTSYKYFISAPHYNNTRLPVNNEEVLRKIFNYLNMY